MWRRWLKVRGGDRSGAFLNGWSKFGRWVGIWLWALAAFGSEGPVISPIDDVTLLTCSEARIPFHVSEADSAPGALKVAGASSNEDVARVEVSAAEEGGDWTVRVVSSGFGGATVTVTASDGGASVTESFHVTVMRCLEPPVLSPIPDLQIGENESRSIELRVQFCDPCVDPSSVRWFAFSDNAALLPAASLWFLPNGTNATLVLTPQTNEVGQARVRVSVSDGFYLVSSSFYFRVTPVFAGRARLSGGNRAAISFEGSRPADLVMEVSADLTQWTQIRTNSATALFEIEARLDEGPRRFFRVRVGPDL